MLAARVEQKNEATKHDKNGVMHPVCGKAARTVLGGGRAMKRASLPLLKRREFITLIGGAAAVWPLAARAQQQTMPVIGFLRSAPFVGAEHLVRAFRQGLIDTGFIEGQNVLIEYRSAEGSPSRLAPLASELVNRQVSVIFERLTASIALGFRPPPEVAYLDNFFNTKAYSRSGSRSPSFASSMISLATAVVAGSLRATSPSLPARRKQRTGP